MEDKLRELDKEIQELKEITKQFGEYLKVLKQQQLFCSPLNLPTVIFSKLEELENGDSAWGVSLSIPNIDIIRKQIYVKKEYSTSRILFIELINILGFIDIGEYTKIQLVSDIEIDNTAFSIEQQFLSKLFEIDLYPSVLSQEEQKELTKREKGILCSQQVE